MPIDSFSLKILTVKFSKTSARLLAWSNGAVEFLVGADAGDICEGAAA